MPAGSDPCFAQKVEEITSLGRVYGIKVDLPLSGTDGDVRRISRRIRERCKFIVDLSLERPSCYYELGQIEACGIDPQLVAAKGTPIHQSANRGKVEEYSGRLEFMRIVERVLIDIKRANDGVSML